MMTSVNVYIAKSRDVGSSDYQEIGVFEDAEDARVACAEEAARMFGARTFSWREADPAEGARRRWIGTDDRGEEYVVEEWPVREHVRITASA